MSETYAGDITPTEAWEILKTNDKAVLIDVRTEAEWAWVGQPDLSSLNKQHLLIEWVRFPGGVPNESFAAEVSAQHTDKTAPILFLCRSGVRSKYASIVMTEAGYETCYNVAGGFEGDHNTDKHRGTVNGWKVENLPWAQG